MADEPTEWPPDAVRTTRREHGRRVDAFPGIERGREAGAFPGLPRGADGRDAAVGYRPDRRRDTSPGGERASPGAAVLGGDTHR
jgi:hypothetical protein